MHLLKVGHWGHVARDHLIRAGGLDAKPGGRGFVVAVEEAQAAVDAIYARWEELEQKMGS